MADELKASCAYQIKRGFTSVNHVSAAFQIYIKFASSSEKIDKLGPKSSKTFCFPSSCGVLRSFGSRTKSQVLWRELEFK